MYTLVPCEVMRGLQNVQKPADEQIMDDARQGMQKVTRNYSRRSKKSSAATRFNQYQKSLQNLIKTKKSVENRPVLIEIARPKKKIVKLSNEEVYSVKNNVKQSMIFKINKIIKLIK